MSTKPTKPFRYPVTRDSSNGRRMCADGQVRAAEYGRQILSGEATAEEIEEMARRGEVAMSRGADTHKRNLIAFIVFYLFRRGQLEEYVNTEGDFVKNSGKLSNLRNYEKIARRFRKE